MPSIKDIVAGQSVGVGKRVIKAGADKLRGIINDRTGGGMPSFGAFGMTKLTYPLDVVDDPQQGHYIVFTVRESTKKAEVDSSKTKEKSNPVDITSSLSKGVNRFGVLGGLGGSNIGSAVSGLKSKVTKIADQKIENYTEAYKDLDTGKHQDGQAATDAARGHGDSAKDKQGKGRFSLRKGTKRTSTMISLYMPPQVKNITGVTYKDQEMGMITTLAGSISEVLGISGDDRRLDDIDISGMGFKAALRAIGNATGMEAQELAQLQSGKLFSPRMEFIFDAVKKRVFTYQFSFYPKSEQESMEVEKIIQTFRKHMLPTRMDTGQDILALNVPNEFNIEYYYKGNENNFINKVGTCLLTDCDITYGGDRYGTFKPGMTRDGLPGASPTETHMTITFQEMDIITQEDINTGF